MMADLMDQRMGDDGAQGLTGKRFSPLLAAHRGLSPA
jgi:hypothetical protein